jgi:cellobiose phosphorylase
MVTMGTDALRDDAPNCYGFFDDDAREYVITRPDTPLPWLNYLGQDEFFGLCTNTAGGYTFWKDAKLRRLTRYRYNNIPYDLGGRYLYVNDAGSVWNPGWKPVKAQDVSYECRHGLGYTRITGEKDGLEVECLFFVPPGENLELWKITVRNKSGERKTPSIFSYQEFCFYEALNDMTNYQRTYSIGEVEVDGSSIYHKTEFRERRNHYTLFACTEPVAGFDTSRDRFVGVHEGLHEARAPFFGACTNSVAFGWNPIGAHQVDLDLGPGEEKTFTFILAYVEQESPKFESKFVINKEQGRAILEKYSNASAVDAAFDHLAAYWNALLGRFQADCPNEHATRMLNVWNQYQCMATFNLSRSASMYETGIGRGMGFRDSAQDLLGFVHLIPSRARQRILDIAATQLSTGVCYHQYQPLTKKGNSEAGGDFYDDHLWLVLATCAYIKETGDISILNEPTGYADKQYVIREDRETLLHHLETSIGYTMRKRGPNGLPLIGRADWNDCLNLNCYSTEPNESYQNGGLTDLENSKAESVMIAGLFLYASREMAELYEFLERPADGDRMREVRETMLCTVEDVAWDGEWYRRAYDRQGDPVGSHLCAEGKIFIESQGWCVLGGAGSKNGRAAKAMASMEKHLFTKNGIVLQQPAYSEYNLNLGEISSYPPGVKENAGIFCHNNTWIHLAWCELGDGDRALEYYLSICPSAKQDQIDTYRSEPYVYAQMIAGKDASCFGEAKNSWLTGTAAWTFVSVSQGLLGIKPDYRGLRIDPCIPHVWSGFTATRHFRGDTYQITVKNPKGVCKGIATVSLDGTPLDPSRPIPVVGDGSKHQVEVVLG